MARISTYAVDNNIESQDKVLGTDRQGFGTKNYTFEGIVNWFNATGAVSINSQNNYFFQSNAGAAGRAQGTISFDSFGGVGTGFSSITTFKLAEKSVAGYTLEDYLPTMVGEKTMLAQTDNLNNFGIYNIVSIERDLVETAFFNVILEYIEGHGSLELDKFYGFSLYAGNDASDKTYVFVQSVPSTSWTVTHNLNKFPSCTMVLSTGQQGYGDVTFIDENNLTITFASAETGKAYIN
jgi:hypothetical protein